MIAKLIAPAATRDEALDRLARRARRDRGRRRHDEPAVPALARRAPGASRRRGSRSARGGPPAGGTSARVLGVKPYLDRGRRAGSRPHVEQLAARDAQLPLHEVDPLTASVTGCSTWMRPFSSRKKNRGLEHELRGAGADVADRAREAHRGVAHLRAQVGVERRRRATPRAPSGAAAGPSSRARRARASCRVRRRAAGSRRGAAARRSARDRRVVAERRCGLALRGRGSASSSSDGSRTTRMPRPPPPAAAFTISGGSVAAGTVGTPASSAIRFAASLSPPLRSASAGGPTHVEPGCLDGIGEVAVLGEEAVPGMDRVGAGLPRGADVLGGVEVGADLDRRVGRARMQEPASSGATTATVPRPSSRAARKTRSAISPRLATSTFCTAAP